MNLQQFVLKHGTGRLLELAELTGTTSDYLQNLLYTVNSGHNPPKTPSIKLALKLCKASDDELDMKGLASPMRMPNLKEAASANRPRMKKGFAKNRGRAA